jgi:RNA polymerase sigma-70 factor (ECF subfamily)
VETSVSLLDRLAGRADDADWRRLHDLYAPLLRAWLARADITGADAEDLAQEVMMVVVRELPAFEWRGPGAFRAWLRAILLHRVRDFCRARQRRPAAPGGTAFLERLAELAATDSPLSRLWDREHDEFVAARALERVRVDFAPATWEAFHRHVLDARPAAEVAAALGVSLNVVLLARSRILKRLRQELRGLID